MCVSWRPPRCNAHERHTQTTTTTQLPVSNRNSGLRRPPEGIVPNLQETIFVFFAVFEFVCLGALSRTSGSTNWTAWGFLRQLNCRLVLWNLVMWKRQCCVSLCKLVFRLPHMRTASLKLSNRTHQASEWCWADNCVANSKDAWHM